MRLDSAGQGHRLGVIRDIVVLMDHQTFEEAASDMMGALGDPTRRSIYLSVRASTEAKSVADIATLFEIHSNVARYHLDHLVDAEFLRVSTSATGSTGGRPAHLYTATDREIHLDLPAQSFELLAGLLTQVLQRVPSGDLTNIAYEVGLAHGEQLARNVDIAGGDDLTSTVEAVAAVMATLGFRTHPSTVGDECGYATTHCPFGRVALENPRVVCALDRGLVTGLMQALGVNVDVTVAPHTRLPEPCTTTVTIRS